MSSIGWAIATLEEYHSNAILDRAAIWIRDNNSAFKSTLSNVKCDRVLLFQISLKSRGFGDNDRRKKFPIRNQKSTY
ncbi:hypothetical protein [Microcoleus sp. POL10_C6]|uniref:hypothetical protein n=1 Tax=unclassified Microcoleus TaxID=2642155 RepID=UPI002FD0912E